MPDDAVPLVPDGTETQFPEHGGHANAALDIKQITAIKARFLIFIFLFLGGRYGFMSFTMSIVSNSRR
jgi:hypothetical protein